MRKTSAQRALIILASYDYESLQITLASLEHTIDESETVLVVLNGKRLNTASEKTERVARHWAAKNPTNRFAVRPMAAGKSAFRALTEVISEFEPLRNVKYICKIDDDLIPLKKNWLNNLQSVYEKLAEERNIGFVTGLINNNCWGFKELIDVFDKKDEFDQICNYTSISGDQGENRIASCTIDNGKCGSVWTYPYLAWWIHEWTSLQPNMFVEKTNLLGIKEIPSDTLYSIGCIFFERSFWLSLDAKKHKTVIDEDLLHEYCKTLKKEKWAVLNEPMIHLFYRTQRKGNAEITTKLLPALASYFNDPSFNSIAPLIDADIETSDTKADDIRAKVNYIHKKLASLSLLKNWKDKKAHDEYNH